LLVVYLLVHIKVFDVLGPIGEDALNFSVFEGVLDLIIIVDHPIRGEHSPFVQVSQNWVSGVVYEKHT